MTIYAIYEYMHISRLYMIMILDVHKIEEKQSIEASVAFFFFFFFFFLSIWTSPTGLPFSRLLM